MKSNSLPQTTILLPMWLTSTNNSLENVVNTLTDVHNSLDDAINRKNDTFFSNEKLHERVGKKTESKTTLVNLQIIIDRFKVIIKQNNELYQNGLNRLQAEANELELRKRSLITELITWQTLALQKYKAEKERWKEAQEKIRGQAQYKNAERKFKEIKKTIKKDSAADEIYTKFLQEFAGLVAFDPESLDENCHFQKITPYLLCPYEPCILSESELNKKSIPELRKWIIQSEANELKSSAKILEDDYFTHINREKDFNDKEIIELKSLNEQDYVSMMTLAAELDDSYRHEAVKLERESLLEYNNIKIEEKALFKNIDDVRHNLDTAYTDYLYFYHNERYNPIKIHNLINKYDKLKLAYSKAMQICDTYANDVQMLEKKYTEARKKYDAFGAEEAVQLRMNANLEIDKIYKIAESYGGVEEIIRSKGVKIENYRYLLRQEELLYLLKHVLTNTKNTEFWNKQVSKYGTMTQIEVGLAKVGVPNGIAAMHQIVKTGDRSVNPKRALMDLKEIAEKRQKKYANLWGLRAKETTEVFYTLVRDINLDTLSESDIIKFKKELSCLKYTNNKGIEVHLDLEYFLPMESKKISRPTLTAQ